MTIAFPYPFLSFVWFFIIPYPKPNIDSCILFSICYTNSNFKILFHYFLFLFSFPGRYLHCIFVCLLFYNVFLQPKKPKGLLHLGGFSMLNFVFHSPTKFVFGKGEEHNVGSYLHPYTPQKVLVVYGRPERREIWASRPGLCFAQASGLPYVSLSGVQPNPRYELAQEGIALCKREQVDFVLAIGGGSVIDTAKCIAAGALYDGDPCKIFSSIKRLPRPPCLWHASSPLQRQALKAAGMPSSPMKRRG